MHLRAVPTSSDPPAEARLQIHPEAPGPFPASEKTRSIESTHYYGLRNTAAEQKAHCCRLLSALRTCKTPLAHPPSPYKLLSCEPSASVFPVPAHEEIANV